MSVTVESSSARVREDGAIVVETVLTGQSAPTPLPPVGPLPAGTAAVRIGAAVHSLAAINPTAATNPAGAGYPGFRGPNQLIAVQGRDTSLTTNPYGVTVILDAVGRVLERRTAATTVAVPTGGAVLSGHGSAAAWLLAYAATGVAVQASGVAPDPATEPPVPFRAGTVAVYMMDGVGTIGQIPAECNQLRVGFLQGSGLVEWGGDSPAKTAADVNAWRRPSVREVLLAIGGQDGAVDERATLDAVRRVEDSITLDGIDWDKEGGALDVAAAVTTSVALAAGRRDTWTTSFTPPGGPPVAVYLDAARRCMDAGLRVQFGQQLYDTTIGLSDVLRQIELAVARLGQERVLLGCMVGSDPSKYSTVEQWEGYMRVVRSEWPRIGGCYLWESSRPGTAEWGRRMSAVLSA